MIIAIVAVLLLLVGLVLLVRGIQQRSAASTPSVWVPPVPQPPPPAVPADPASAAAGDFYAAPAPASPWSSAPPPMAPPAPAASGVGTRALVAGTVLMALGVLAGLAGFRHTYPKRTISMPTTLLGSAENTTLTGQFRGQFLHSLPANVKQADLAVYGTAPDLFFVVGGTGRISSPDSEIADSHHGVGLPLAETHAVDPGPLGGRAECSTSTTNGVGLEFCVFVDRGSLIATFDFGRSGPAAEARALQMRNAVVH